MNDNEYMQTIAVPKPPLGKIPYLPPKNYCENHLGDRVSGPPCVNCRPLTENEKIMHQLEWEMRNG